MKVLIAGFELAGAGDKSVDQFSINGSTNIDIADFPNADEPDFFDRKNEKNRVTFQVSRLFASDALAQQFVLEHYDAAPRKGTISFITTGSGGIVTKYMNGALVSMGLRFTGVTVFANYELVGGKISNTDPNP